MVGWPCLRFRYQSVVGGIENHRWGGHLSDYGAVDHPIIAIEEPNSP